MKHLFQLRLNQLRNNFRLLRKTGRLRVLIGIFVLLVVWAGIFAGFYRAFLFLRTFMGVGDILIDRLIYLLTFALFVMLVFSNAVISFQLHFKAKETAYLLTLPLPRPVIFRFLLLEGVFLSTWATIFLIFPVVLAYGMTHKLSFYAGISLPIFAAGLIFLAALIGVLIASLIPRFLARGKIAKMLILIFIILISASPLWSSLAPAPQRSPDRKTLMINRLLEHSRITLSPVFPGYWAAEGFIRGVKGRIGRSLGFIAVLAVNLLLAWQVVELTAGRTYHRTWSLYKSRGVRRRKSGRDKLWEGLPGPSPNLSSRLEAPPAIGTVGGPSRPEPEPIIAAGSRSHSLPSLGTVGGPSRPEPEPIIAAGSRSHSLPHNRVKATTSNFRHFQLLSNPTRALIVKDLKIFIREPARWLQAAILFGLLTIYILNIRNMPRNVYQPFWKNLITFFNLGATSLILATLTTRFVYPSFSLEGRTFWVLGLAPIRRANIFRIKFWSNFIAAAAVTVPLMLLSNHILEVSGIMTLLTCGIVILMAGVLVSLATGLGAIFPRFSEDNPSRIASGFGGTLNLILSLIYIAMVVSSLALGYYLRRIDIAADHLRISVPAVVFILLLSMLGSYFPFKLGVRALEKCEF